MPYFENKGAKIYYEVHGKGQALILCHGASWDHESWQEQVNYFKSDYQCITWDLRGHGKSSMPEGQLTVEDFIDDFLRLFEILEIEKAHIAGLSLGGILSTRMAALHPDKVEKLILIGTIYSFTATFYEKLLVPINRWYFKHGNFNLAVKMSHKAYSKVKESTGLYASECLRKIGQNRFAKLWDCITRIDNKDLLKDVQAETLLLHGDLDSTTSRQQKHMQTAIKNCTFTSISKAYHGTNLDNPEQVNCEMDQFLLSE